MARTTIETIVKHDPSINSEGIFINLMTSFNRYIGEEYKSGRITGRQFAEVYLGGMVAVLGNSIDYTKHLDAMDIQEAQLALQEEKLELERELNETQKKLIEAQTQAFKARHQKDMAKLIFDTVTIGVTQEQMNILAGPNAIFEGLVPKAEFEAARWVDTP